MNEVIPSGKTDIQKISVILQRREKEKSLRTKAKEKVFRVLKYKLNLWILGTTAIILILMFLTSLWKPFPGLELWTQDYRQQGRLAGLNGFRYPQKALQKYKNNLPKPNTDDFYDCFDVCIIAEDEKSINKLDGTPFSYDEYSQAVIMLQELQAAVISFDKLFFEERKKHFPQGTKNFVTAIKYAKDQYLNTVIGWKFDISHENSQKRLATFAPLSQLQDITSKGFLNVSLSPIDKGIRKYGFNHYNGESIALASYLATFSGEQTKSKLLDDIVNNVSNQEIKEIFRKYLIAPSQERDIEFYGNPGFMPRISLYDLITGFRLLHPSFDYNADRKTQHKQLIEILNNTSTAKKMDLLSEKQEIEAEILSMQKTLVDKSTTEQKIIRANIEYLKNVELNEIKQELNELKNIDAFSSQELELNPDEQALLDKLNRAVKGRVAIVGPWTLDSQDLYNVPVTSATESEARMYGVEIHATAIQNLFDMMQNSSVNVAAGLKYSSDSRTYQIIIVTVILAAIATIFLPPLWSTALIVISLVGYWFFSYHAFVYDKEFYPVVLPMLSIFSTFVGLTITKFFTTDKEKKQIDSMFKSYIDRRFVELLKKDPQKIKLGGERKDITVFFSDIAGFSTFSENLEPETIVEVLNEYLGAMTDVILEYDGTLDKYIGDAVMAFWNAPIDIPDHAARACLAAIDQRKKLMELRKLWVQKGYPDIDCRMGINTGQILHANMGSRLRMDYSLIGDPVNLAARFEPLNKDFNTNIIIGENTFEQARDAVVVRPLGKVKVKGREKPVAFYELIAKAGNISVEMYQQITKFSDALKYYFDADFETAFNFFSEILEINPNDGPSSTYLELCRQNLANPPDLTKWSGVFIQTHK